ncbi:MAG TPA: hypothetical protein VFB63_09840 [Bryobacteraceae bacterium]|nr:hypothetical protein [Bryobacteraceae bacterium]
MEFGTLQIQIFVSLVVVLGTAFVAFLCDFLKGNNEQLRERNIEMRVRQDERERLGLSQPGYLLKGIEALLRNTPGLRVGTTEETAPTAATAASETQTAPTWEQPIVAPAGKGSAWATKEELEKLAERAARIRERHEARKAADDFTEEEPAVLALVSEMPFAAVAEGRVVASEVVSEEVPAVAEAADAVAEPIAEAPQETPPPLVEEAGAPASAEAEATPVIETVAEVEPDERDEPASHIQLQPLAIAEIRSFDPAPTGLAAPAEEPSAIAPGPDLVMKPMSTATIIPSEPGELLAKEKSQPAAGEFESELMRVRVVPVGQSVPAVEELPEVITEVAPEPVSEMPVEVRAYEPATPVEGVIGSELEPLDLEMVVARVSDMENGADINSLHESLVIEEAGLPPGLHPAEVLRRQIKENAPFQGVAVSIGINDYEALRQKLDTPDGADSLPSIEKMIRGMLKEPDFACRFQDDEYILLFPGEADSAAQRRLFQISEKLWDFQLRSLGHHSIMFSWGGLEVKRDSLSDAVSAARERMFQTKRNRTGAIEMRKRVVNG